jgi:hypothetical protein
MSFGAASALVNFAGILSYLPNQASEHAVAAGFDHQQFPGEPRQRRGHARVIDGIVPACIR